MEINKSVLIKKDNYLAHVVYETKQTQTFYAHIGGMLKLAEQNCPIEILSNIVTITVLLHDAGKLSDEFYMYMKNILEKNEDTKRGQIDHSSAGGGILKKIISNKKGEREIYEFISYAIYSHHGLNDCIVLKDDGIDKKSGESLYEVRNRKQIDYSQIEDRFFRICDRKILFNYIEEARIDFLDICKNVGKFTSKGENRYYGENYFYIGMYERLLLSLLIDSDWTDTSCFMKGEPLPKRISDNKIYEIWKQSIINYKNHLKNLIENGKYSPLNTYRNEISDICYRASQGKHNLYRLSVPTGSGKTLSSLRFALNHALKFRKKHIYYVSSYNSLLEQNAKEIREAIGNCEWVLEHHCNVMMEDEEKETEYLKLTENWDSPIIATTAVQMLNTLYSSKKSSIRRMYNLCNSVIIFDEVQAFPVQHTELFHLAVNFLTEFCNTAVVLCSATQPSLVNLPCNNLYNCVEMIENQKLYLNKFKRVEIINKTDLVSGGMNLDQLNDFVWQNFQRHLSVLIVLNTKKSAKFIYEKLMESCPDNCEVYHLSTNMCAKNRQEELEQMRKSLKDKKRIICVSTQLIEAGVDLSFACVIRSLAGIDNIIQSAGRCNRHKETETGEVYIVELEDKLENLDRLPEIREAQDATKKVLDFYKRHPELLNHSLDSEESIRKYYESYLGVDVNISTVRRTQYKSKIPDKALDDILGKNTVGLKAYKEMHLNSKDKKCPFMRQAFKMAGDEYKVIADDEKINVVIPYDEKAKLAIEILENNTASIEKKKRALRQLQLYSVGISQCLREKLNDAIYSIGDGEILILNEGYYDKKVGILEEPKFSFLEF